ncbi:MAG: multifunctional oxoglutarate decarboxylase/oxoglutarate dehydrogenase thiamine pyrophosphate-binding subunit/dihydrolipoyllysine-residue succinyltransferase subunit, partial [Actinomycetota bacterium]|nr:multifunctional oxoglutarate decarboxylase/oxoglutarate dehydrogenase thiamine pyrophosphate-binding subunit/dihydrolipoyllysine-residue succinyltransferase subunit [Actinomycetota bacterium]
VVIDQFLVAAEDKWGQASGLVLLLPHGYEGQGPEHSSARLERFLTQSAEHNMQIVNCTTSAQYFHLLRRQALRGRRKPLIVLSPKSLLRSRRSRSSVDELLSGRFQEVIDDPAPLDPSDVRRVVLASGKMAYDVMDGRDQAGAAAAVVRVEQLYPWPEEQIAEVLGRYPHASEVFWVQEEPENMGAWNFVHGRLHRLLRDRYELRHVSRIESGSPAAGSAALHQMEQEGVVLRALAGLSG